ncbi:TetR/AcrR family transcriptional regulator C-terminal domain-containing protein [Nonomuraea sp. NPDC050310]|uniref:TetR/AcrR family transcriptional regulator C-terminal domain-containing protein n=1 Tax=unclassified Nonomuraea TaxID=2593643 RepID=UPI0033DE6E02
MTAPYLRIVADLRRDIDTGRLRPGDRLPSTRRLARDYGVAMATATKALTALQHQGLAYASPGIGTIVADPAPPPTPKTPAAGPDPLLRAAIRIADTEGLPALSMRRLAADLGRPTMSLYRQIHDKDELITLMTDAVLGERHLPDPPPPGWRTQLETLARLQWQAYRDHPWLAEVLSFTRPALSPHGMAQTEWALRALHHHGLGANATLHAALSLATYVRGVAVNLPTETAARADTGLDEDQWLAAQHDPLQRLLHSGDYPTLTALLTDPALDYDLDSLFTFGLTRLLDGLALLIDTAGERRRD